MAIDPNLVTTMRTGELPTSPFSLTDKIAHEVGTDLKHSTIEDLISFIAPLVSAIQYQVITLHVDQAYIDANFNMTPGSTMGLGINLMTGYAIINGNNGTINKDGRTGIAYGSVFNVIGQVGGFADSTLPAHSHSIGIYNNDTTGVSVADASGTKTGTASTSTTGENAVGKNYPPYLVELQVMKL